MSSTLHCCESVLVCGFSEMFICDSHFTVEMLIFVSSFSSQHNCVSNAQIPCAV